MQISDQNNSNSIEYKLPLNNEQMYEKLVNRLGKDKKVTTGNRDLNNSDNLSFS